MTSIKNQPKWVSLNDLQLWWFEIVIFMLKDKVSGFKTAINGIEADPVNFT